MSERTFLTGRGGDGGSGVPTHQRSSCRATRRAGRRSLGGFGRSGAGQGSDVPLGAAHRTCLTIPAAGVAPKPNLFWGWLQELERVDQARITREEREAEEAAIQRA